MGARPWLLPGRLLRATGDIRYHKIFLACLEAVAVLASIKHSISSIETLEKSGLFNSINCSHIPVPRVRCLLRCPIGCSKAAGLNSYERDTTLEVRWGCKGFLNRQILFLSLCFATEHIFSLRVRLPPQGDEISLFGFLGIDS